MFVSAYILPDMRQYEHFFPEIKLQKKDVWGNL